MKHIQICKPNLILCLLTFSFVGCASYLKRKDCEQVNWYEYGQKVALSGRRLESDQLLNDCRKVEAEISETKLDLGYKSGRDRYCTMDEIFNTGKSGHPFSYELCDHLPRQKVKDRHLEGVLIFCKPDNGYSFGAKGGVYESVCPEEKEVPFLKEYKKGRKVYLQASIKTNESEIADLEKDNLQLQNEKSLRLVQLARLPVAPVMVTQAQSGDAKRQVVDLYKQERDRLQSEVNSLSDRIQFLEAKKEKLKSENREMQKELLSL